MKVFLTLFLIVLSIIGIADASYITYEEFSGIVPPCGQGFQCEKVLTSQWSHIGPVPLSLLGLGYYITVFAFAILLYLGFKKLPIALPIIREWPLTKLLLLMTSFGALFSVYLIFIMAVLIQGWCLYCLISATTSMLLFGTSLVLWKKTSTEIGTTQI